MFYGRFADGCVNDARGICKVDEDNFLTDVVETKNKVAPFNNKMNNIRIDLCTDYK